MSAAGLAGKQVSFIGGGNMAEALLHGMLEKKLFRPFDVCVSEPIEERRQSLTSRFGVVVTASNAEAIREADIVVLAVKPQVMASVLKEIRDGIALTRPLLVSIAAGLTSRFFEEALGGEPRTVRVMPNTPALVGKGIAGVSPGRFADPEDVETACMLIRSVGRAVIVEETAMDAVTAISGSGPAYGFRVMEAMLEAAAQLGLDPAVSKQLVVDTLEGAAALARASEDPPGVLRQRVTSKGGTTEAALKVLEERGFGEALRDAVLAAAARSRELSGNG